MNWVAHASRVLVSASSRSRTLLRCCSNHMVLLKERLFRRDAEASTRDAYATLNPSPRRTLMLQLPARVAVPSANGGYATLPHSAIRPDSEAQNDPGKIA